MASRGDQIVEHITDLLGVSGGPAGLAVHRFRTRPITDDELPAIAVYPIARRSEQDDFSGSVRHRMTVRVECRASGDPPDAELDPLYVWAVEQITADPTLGGLAFDTQEVATQWAAELADAVYGAAAVDFEVEYLTAAGDPSAAPGD